jgi:hypothetical protein
VEGVDVLRHQQEVALTPRLPSLEHREGTMGRIRPCRKDADEAGAIPAPRANRVRGEVAQRRQLGDVVRPDRPRVAAAERRDAARQADPGAGQDDDQPLRRLDGGNEPPALDIHLGSLFERLAYDGVCKCTFAALFSPE